MADDGDARDERLAGLLDVEPLDELTRRRLVSAAVRASAPPVHLSRRLVAAAAIAGVAVAAGLGYLVSRDGDTTSPTASRDQSALTTPADSASESVEGASGATPPAAAASAPSSLTPKSGQRTFDAPARTPRDAGDFGDLRTAANLDRLRTALSGSETAATTAGATPSDRVTSLLAQLGERSCAGELPEGTVVAVGTGRFGTRDAIVVQTELPDGSRSIDVVVDHPCAVRPLD
jgi:hypothetical protein